MNSFTRLHTLRTSFVNVVLGYSGYLGYFCKKYKVHCFLYYKEKIVFHLHVLVNLIYTVLNKHHSCLQPNQIMLRIHISNIELSYSRLLLCFMFIYDILIIDL